MDNILDSVKRLHFVGIGGSGMCPMAELLMNKGYEISGSDMSESDTLDRVKGWGIPVFMGHRGENIGDAQAVVYTAACKADNPELVAAREKGVPTLERSVMLGMLTAKYPRLVAGSGTPGKTTTTSMIAQILLEADVDPTLSIGGVYKPIGGNIRVGSSEYFVTEACEYTNSFLSFFPKIGIILNIEEDHLDFFKDIQDIRNSFHRFALLLPEDGTLIINNDIKHVEEITAGLSCQVVTYGSSPSSNYRASQITYDAFGCPSFHLMRKEGKEEVFSLKVHGEHNVSNALAAIALADVLGIPDDVTQKGLLAFNGTDRRFEYKGQRNGVNIIDDYAHHPTEIRATLTAAGEYPHKKLWCVFQPHTYTRTKAFLDEFADALCLADEVILADIYAAREKDTLGISSQTLQEKIEALGHSCHYFPDFEAIENFLIENCTKDDLLITMGAGDIVKIAENLLKK